MSSNRPTLLTKWLAYTIALVMVLVPFTAFITTWLGSNFGHLDAFRIWKEIVVFAIAPFALYIAIKDKRLRKWLTSSWLPALIFLYILLHVLLGIIALHKGQVNRVALIYALLINLRYFGFFLVVVVVASQTNWLKMHWRQIVLWPAAGVVIFGLFQRFVLPYDFLKHFGYGPKTIPAVETVDQKIAYRRIQSTLRGANPLGAYLVVILPLTVAGWRKGWRQALVILAGAVTLFYTYSRSAWIGAFISLALIGFWLAGAKWRRLFAEMAALVIILLGGIILFRHNSIVQNSIFHTDNTSHSTVSSNASRWAEIKQATKDVLHEPLGRGPGTAGPASFRNKYPARIAENYYLQIAQEVGLFGISLFIVINVLIARLLWQQRKDPLAMVMLTTLVGLTFVNLVSHAWADDTLAYVWWGLAAIAATPAILNEKRKHYGQKA